MISLYSLRAVVVGMCLILVSGCCLKKLIGKDCDEPEPVRQTISAGDAALLADAYAYAFVYPESFYSHVRNHYDAADNAAIDRASRILAQLLRNEAAQMPSDAEIEESIYNIGAEAGVPGDITSGTADDMKNDKDDLQRMALYLDELRIAVGHIVVNDDTSYLTQSNLYNAAILMQYLLNQWVALYQLNPDPNMHVNLMELQRFMYDVLVWYMKLLMGFSS